MHAESLTTHNRSPLQGFPSTMKKSHIRQRAIVLQVQKGSRFLLSLEDMPEHRIAGYLCGKMQAKRICLVKGDEVDVEISIYDLYRGRIVWRHEI